jgi:hypothetical protein
MRYPIINIFISVIFSQCGENNNKTSQCKNSRFYGKVEVCLPDINGMRECMTHPKLQGRPGILMSEENTTLGIYLNDSSINQLEVSQNPENVAINGYFKVYGIGKIKGMTIGQSDFDDFAKAFKNQFIHQDWTVVKNEIAMSSLEDELNNLNAQMGKPLKSLNRQLIQNPVEILNYKLNEQISTSVLIIRNQGDKVVVNTMSIVKVLDTIIFYSFYEEYKDESTIENVKNQNNKFGLELLNVNKSL